VAKLPFFLDLVAREAAAAVVAFRLSGGPGEQFTLGIRFRFLDGKPPHGPSRWNEACASDLARQAEGRGRRGDLFASGHGKLMTKF